MQEKVNECTANEKNALKVIQRSCTQEFEEIIKSKKSDIIWLAYYQGQIFWRSCTQKFKEKERFVCMVLKFNVSKSIIMFKIELIDNYLKIKNSSLSLHYFKKHLKTIREVCKRKCSWI